MHVELRHHTKRWPPLNKHTKMNIYPNHVYSRPHLKGRLGTGSLSSDISLTALQRAKLIASIKGYHLRSRPSSSCSLVVVFAFDLHPIAFFTAALAKDWIDDCRARPLHHYFLQGAARELLPPNSARISLVIPPFPVSSGVIPYLSNFDFIV